jgi:membrane fusion protein (multidrug efflux system)
LKRDSKIFLGLIVILIAGLFIANRMDPMAKSTASNTQEKDGAANSTKLQQSATLNRVESKLKLDQYLNLAEQGDADAQYKLAMLYDLGKEVPQDFALAADWYMKSAQNGNAKSFYQMGQMSDLGHGMAQSFKKATSFYRQAAALGHEPAQNRLKIMYAQGLSVPPTNKTQAMTAVDKLPVLTAAMPLLRAPSRGNDGKSLNDEMECMLEPHLVSNIGSPVEGVLSEVTVDRGDYVSKGQIVAHLRSDVEKATVEWRKAQEQFGMRKVQRNEELFKKQLISANEKDELETQTLIAGLELKEKQEILKQRIIRSPLNGVVVERFLVPGERVFQQEILKIAQIDPLNVELVVPVEMFGKIKLGMAAKVNLNPLLSGAYKAKVIVIDKVIDAASGTFGVRLELRNPGNKIPAGIKCRLSF